MELTFFTHHGYSIIDIPGFQESSNLLPRQTVYKTHYPFEILSLWIILKKINSGKVQKKMNPK